VRKTFKQILSVAALGTFIALNATAADVDVTCPSGIDHSAWDRLLKKYVDHQGLVNYTAWKNNSDDRAALDNYLKQFTSKPDKAAQGNERFASLTNAYNAIVITTILNNYPVESIFQTKRPFDTKAWTIGGAQVALNDIENGALRPMLKYRAHSVLVCAARSCPPLQRKAYKANSFEEQTDNAYRTWLAREDLNKFLPQQRKAQISEIFKWFKGDFESSLSVAQILEKYGPEPARQLATGGTQFNISYLSYNWGLNDQGEHGRHYSKVKLLFDAISK
jgi:Protein of unknown function, DUF547